MAFKLHPVDAKLVQRVKLVLHNPQFSDIGKAVIVSFQFPPHLESDGKGLRWNEKNFKNIEPMAIFDGSEAREISLKWCYVVTGEKGWSVKDIAKKVKGIRGYFYQTINNWDDDSGEGIRADFYAYNAVGPGTGAVFSFRPTTLSVSYSDKIILTDDGSFPIKTDLNMKLRMWTKGAETDGDGDKPLQDLPWLKKVGDITAEWY